MSTAASASDDGSSVELQVQGATQAATTAGAPAQVSNGATGAGAGAGSGAGSGAAAGSGTAAAAVVAPAKPPAKRGSRMTMADLMSLQNDKEFKGGQEDGKKMQLDAAVHSTVFVKEYKGKASCSFCCPAVLLAIGILMSVLEIALTKDDELTCSSGDEGVEDIDSMQDETQEFAQTAVLNGTAIALQRVTPCLVISSLTLLATLVRWILMTYLAKRVQLFKHGPPWVVYVVDGVTKSAPLQPHEKDVEDMAKWKHWAGVYVTLMAGKARDIVVKGYQPCCHKLVPCLHPDITPLVPLEGSKHDITFEDIQKAYLRANLVARLGKFLLYTIPVAQLILAILITTQSSACWGFACIGAHWFNFGVTIVFSLRIECLSRKRSEVRVTAPTKTAIDNQTAHTLMKEHGFDLGALAPRSRHHTYHASANVVIGGPSTASSQV